MTDTRDLLIIGAGGHSTVVIDAALLSGWRIVGAVDDDTRAVERLQRLGVEHLGGLDDLPSIAQTARPTVVHAATGDSLRRRAWFALVPHLGEATIIHPTAVVSAAAHIGQGVFIGAYAIVNPFARVEEGAIVNTGAIVEHDAVVGAFARIAPGAVLAGAAHVGEETLIGIRAAVLPGIHIGPRSVLAAGAVAVSDIPDDTMAHGVPARQASRPLKNSGDV